MTYVLLLCTVPHSCPTRLGQVNFFIFSKIDLPQRYSMAKLNLKVSFYFVFCSKMSFGWSISRVFYWKSPKGKIRRKIFRIWWIKPTISTVKSQFSAYVSIFARRIDLEWFWIEILTFRVSKVKVEGQKAPKWPQIF